MWNGAGGGSLFQDGSARTPAVLSMIRSVLCSWLSPPQSEPRWIEYILVLCVYVRVTSLIAREKFPDSIRARNFPDMYTTCRLSVLLQQILLFCCCRYWTICPVRRVSQSGRVVSGSAHRTDPVVAHPTGNPEIRASLVLLTHEFYQYFCFLY